MKQRLHKILASAGIASLRKSETLITEGRVQVNGVTANIGDSADLETDDIVVDGNQVSAEQKRYILLNKPTGYVTTVTDPHGRPTVLDLINVRERIYPVGRLDTDTEGLLILTNDGEFSQRMAHPRYEIEKTYLAELSKPLTGEGEQLLTRGIRLEDGPTHPAKLKVVNARRRRVLITIHEGRNRIVRRMFESVESPVIKLRRIGFGSLELGDLAKGQARELRGAEVDALLALAVELVPDRKRIGANFPEIESDREARRAAFDARRPVRRPGARGRRAGFTDRRSTARPRRGGSGGARRAGPRSGRR